MMDVKKVRPILVSVMLILGSTFSFAAGDGDFHYWNTNGASVKINDEWKFSIEEEFRFRDDYGDFFYQHSDIGLAYSGLADWLKVSINYRAVLEEKSDDWTWENRPHINADIKTKFEELSISNRSRLEWRIFRNKEDKPRYRNKTTIKFPVKWTKYQWQPYIADEIFYNPDSARVTRNRVYAGVGGKINDSIGAGFYYMLQSNRSSGVWTDTNVLGTKLKFLF